MAVIRAGLLAFGGVLPRPLDVHQLPRNSATASKMTAAACAVAKYSPPAASFNRAQRPSYAGNFLNMMRPTPCKTREVNGNEPRDNVSSIPHADPEQQNASTSTVRTAGSRGAKPVRLHTMPHTASPGDPRTAAPTPR